MENVIISGIEKNELFNQRTGQRWYCNNDRVRQLVADAGEAAVSHYSRLTCSSFDNTAIFHVLAQQPDAVELVGEREGHGLCYSPCHTKQINESILHSFEWRLLEKGLATIPIEKMILVHGVEKAPEGYTWLGMSWEENIYAPTGMVEVLDKEKALIEIINQARNSSLEEFREYIRAANPWQGDRRKIITELRKKRGN